MMPLGVSEKCSRMSATIRLLRKLARAEGLDVHRHRVRDADRVGELDQRALGEAGGDDVLGDVARHVGRRAVDLRGVLARERAAAVRGAAAVGVDDDLAARQAGVALRAADDEAAGRVDVELGVGRQERRRDHRLDDLLDDRFLERRVLDGLGVLRRDDDGLDAQRRGCPRTRR